MISLNSPSIQTCTQSNQSRCYDLICMLLDLDWNYKWTNHVFLFLQMHLQLGETTSQPVWVKFTPTLNQITDTDSEKNPLILIKSGVVSHDGQ